jgi:threonine dehydratase
MNEIQLASDRVAAGRMLFELDELITATRIVAQYVPATPAFRWPLLDAATGALVWVKHENHTPVGAFKVRGGVLHVQRAVLSHDARHPLRLVTATRGNHGQSLAFAGRLHRVPVTVVVPVGNNPEKNAAMAALGARVVIHGRDFDDAVAEAFRLADDEGARFVPSFHPDLVVGVATLAYELFTAASELDAVYVPIGLGSGICGLITVRDLLGLSTEIVGVVASGAPAYALSYDARRVVSTATADTFVDGVACRNPDPLALEIINRGARRVLAIDDDEVAGAMRLLLRTTHNLAEPAGALALAGLWREREQRQGQRVGVVLTGANVDAVTLAMVLSGGDDAPAAS